MEGRDRVDGNILTMVSSALRSSRSEDAMMVADLTGWVVCFMFEPRWLIETPLMEKSKKGRQRKRGK